MRFKIWLILALLVASLFSAVHVVPVSSSHTPCSTDDYQFEEFGPRASQLLIKIYTDYWTELEGFKAKEVDVMDWGLEAVDYQWFVENDPEHLQYSTAFYSEFGLYEYDVNNQVLPTSLLSVRQALSYLIDKDYFIAVYGGFMMKADSVLAAITGWYNPAVTDKYNLQPRNPANPYSDPLDWERAFDLLTADLPLITDPEDPGCMCWAWPTPFPDPSPSGLFGPVPANHLLVFADAGMATRTQQGVWLKQMLEVDFPIILPTLGKPCTRMHVDLIIAPQAVTSVEVKGFFRYHLYTGGWSLGRDPDILIYYTCAEITKPEPYGNNYIMYCNPLFDNEVDLMLTSTTVGNSGLVCDGTYHAFLAQEIMMNDAALIPMWYYVGYKAYLSNWRGVVNEIGFGTNSWWTFLNAHKVGSEGGDVIRYGFAGDVLSLNPITAQSYWDWEVLGKIYDGLIAVNPYDMSQDRAHLAKGWDIGTWGGGNTVLTFHLREDVWWQDVPYMDRTGLVPGGQLNGPFINKPLTALDVAFSIMYIKYNIDAWNGWLTAPVDHIAIPYQYAACWPYQDPSQVPYWWDLDPATFPHDFVQFDPTLRYNDIVVYLNQYMNWIGLHWIGQIPITLYHIWQWIPITTVNAFDPWAWDLVYGTGPWILLDRTAGVSMTMIPFIEGNAYRGITLHNSYFLYARAGDVLIINDPHKLAFFGYYRATQMPSTGWELLNSTILWADSYLPPDETRIVLFTYDGTVSDSCPCNEDAARVYTWLIDSGYVAGNISVHNQHDAEALPPTYYDDFDLVIYWNTFGYNSTNIVISGIPFITVSSMQTDEMGIGTGAQTLHESRNTFHVVNNDYYPTQSYALGKLLFESSMLTDGTQATASGKVLVKAEVESVTSPVTMSLTQNVTVFPDGTANMTFAMNIPNSPLADLYREEMSSVDPVEPGRQYPVPENKTVREKMETEEDIQDLSLSGDINGDGIVNIKDASFLGANWGKTVPPAPPNVDINGDGIINIKDAAIIGMNWLKTRPPLPETVIPVREPFYQSIATEESSLLGFQTLVVNSSWIPWGLNNETKISVEAVAPQFAEHVEGSVWRIYIGPQDDNATQLASDFILTKMQFLQLMLRMFPGDQVYTGHWIVNINLPPGSALLNAGELTGRNWTIDFGGGTIMYTCLSVTSEGVTVDETMTVTEENITATEEYLADAFSHYRVFKIDYALSGLLSQSQTKEKIHALGRDWSYDKTYTFTGRLVSKSWTDGPISATIRVTPKLTISFHVAWWGHWHWLHWRLEGFESWMQVTPSIKAEATVTATASSTKTWSYTFAHRTHRFSFWVGCVPVWVNLKLTATGELTVRASGQVTITASATASAWLQAGVQWTHSGGWSGIWNKGAGASITGPTISGSASLTVTPAAKCRLAFLFYDTAGPFVEAKPYVSMTVTYSTDPNQRTWSIKLMFKVSAGATFADWLKKLLKLKDWSKTLYDSQLASWSGYW
jgi:hypothetical protein